jgi:hypothetical protein
MSGLDVAVLIGATLGEGHDVIDGCRSRVRVSKVGLDGTTAELTDPSITLEYATVHDLLAPAIGLSLPPALSLNL